MILDHDVPPDGETQGQPDGDGVDHQREVDVEEDHHAPTVAKLKCREKFDVLMYHMSYVIHKKQIN